MDASHPTSVEAQEKRDNAKAAKTSTIPDASVVNVQTKQDQLSYLLEATARIEKGLATLTRNQESLERIFETKLHDLDVKISEIQTTIEKLQEGIEDRNDRSTTDTFQRVPREQRSATVPVVSDTRATTSAPAITSPVIPPVATPPAPHKSSEAFADAILSTPSSHTRAPGDRAQSATQHYAFSSFLVTCCQRGESVQIIGFERECVFCFFLPLVLLICLLVWLILYLCVCEILVWSCA